MSIGELAWTAVICVGVLAAVALITILGTALERFLATKRRTRATIRPRVVDRASAGIGAAHTTLAKFLSDQERSDADKRRHDANVNPNPAPSGPPPVSQVRPDQPPITLRGGPLDGERLELSLPMTCICMPCDAARSRGRLYAKYRRDAVGRYVFDGYGGLRFEPDIMAEDWCE
jgi:hypothetical protein